MNSEDFRKENLIIPNRLFSQELGENEAEKEQVAFFLRKVKN